jgi:hypothetical protein
MRKTHFSHGAVGAGRVVVAEGGSEVEVEVGENLVQAPISMPLFLAPAITIRAIHNRCPAIGNKFCLCFHCGNALQHKTRQNALTAPIVSLGWELRCAYPKQDGGKKKNEMLFL